MTDETRTAAAGGGGPRRPILARQHMLRAHGAVAKLVGVLTAPFNGPKPGCAAVGFLPDAPYSMEEAARAAVGAAAGGAGVGGGLGNSVDLGSQYEMPVWWADREAFVRQVQVGCVARFPLCARAGVA